MADQPFVNNNVQQAMGTLYDSCDVQHVFSSESDKTSAVPFTNMD